MGERKKVGRVDGRDVTVWNTAAAGRPSIDRVRASVKIHCCGVGKIWADHQVCRLMKESVFRDLDLHDV